MTNAADFLPASRSLQALEEAAEGCRGCEPYRDSTHTVADLEAVGSALRDGAW